jgi:hypothetical protein
MPQDQVGWAGLFENYPATFLKFVFIKRPIIKNEFNDET